MLELPVYYTSFGTRTIWHFLYCHPWFCPSSTCFDNGASTLYPQLKRETWVSLDSFLSFTFLLSFLIDLDV